MSKIVNTKAEINEMQHEQTLAGISKTHADSLRILKKVAKLVTGLIKNKRKA